MVWLPRGPQGENAAKGIKEALIEAGAKNDDVNFLYADTEGNQGALDYFGITEKVLGPRLRGTLTRTLDTSRLWERARPSGRLAHPRLPLLLVERLACTSAAGFLRGRGWGGGEGEAARQRCG